MMQIYRKGLIVQLLLFIVFFIMGLNVLISYFIGEEAPWLSFVVMGILILFGVGGFIYYRSNDQTIHLITQKELSLIKYLLYIFFFFYLAYIFLQGVSWMDQQFLSIITSIALMGIALFGIYTLLRIIQIKKK